MPYTSCRWLEHGISFNTDHIEMCCLRCHKGGGRINLFEDFDINNFDWNRVLNDKKRFVDDAKNSQLPSQCEGCFELNKKNWGKGRYIDTIHFDHWTKCNSNCLYCFTHSDKNEFNSKGHYNVLPIIEDLFEKKLFKPTGEITFAGGEPTLLEEFDDLVNLFLENGARLKIHTSGLKYSETIAKGIEKGQIIVVLSADSGTKEMYSKVKGVDGFDVFWENVKKYAACQTKNNKNLVSTKYILIPDVNTNKSEIRKWLKLNKKAGVKCIASDVEDNFCAGLREADKPFPRNIRSLGKFIVNSADDLGFKFLFYNNFWYLYYDTQAKRDLFCE